MNKTDKEKKLEYLEYKINQAGTALIGYSIDLEVARKVGAKTETLKRMEEVFNQMEKEKEALIGILERVKDENKIITTK